MLTDSPSSQFLKHRKRSAGLNVPARPGVSEIVPAKVFDAGFLESLLPAPVVDPLDWLSLVTENVCVAIPQLSSHHVQRFLGKGNGDALPCLCLVRMDPGHLPRHVHLGPFEPQDVRHPKTCRQGEQGSVCLVRGEGPEESGRFLMG